jgi:hypothetical protein
MTGKVASASILKTGINGTPRLAHISPFDRVFEKALDLSDSVDVFK